MNTAHRPSLSLPMISDADRKVDRRSFLEQSTRLAALALLAGTGACGVGGSITGPSFGSPVTVKLADYPALAQPGGVARISGVNPPVALSNLGNGTYKALSLICPHQGSTVQWYDQYNAFICPNHGSTYTSSGTWEGGQPTTNLREYPTTYDPNGGTVTIQPR